MGIYEAIKDGVEVARKADNIEVMKQLLDAQKECLDLLDENRKLKERIRELEESQRITGELVFRESSYFRPSATGEEGPFCSVCWDVDRRLVRMHEGSYGQHYCMHCTTKTRK